MNKNDFIDSYVFTRPDIVQWADMDAFQHVNNAQYFRYFERARIACLEELDLLEYMQAHQIGPILASTQCRFKAALSFPDTILIGTNITDLQADRFLMQYAVFSEQQDVVAAEGDGIIVFFDYQQNTKTDIPAGLYKKLKAVSV